jgi:hypothetical protein
MPEKARISSVIAHRKAVLNALLTAMLLDIRGKKDRTNGQCRKR